MSDQFDDINGIFDNVSMADFLDQESSAVGIVSLASQDEVFAGEEAYARFIARCLATLRTSWAAAEGEINPIAILATREKQYIFTPDNDETMEQWTERLRRDAAKLGAGWVFISRVTMVGAAVDSGDQDVEDPDVFERMRREGRARPGVIFYAQRREGGVIDNAYGYMHAEDSTTLSEVVFGHGGQPAAMFNVL